MEKTVHACPFCDVPAALLRNDLAYAVYDKNPVNPGHVLIVPFRHVASYFDTTPDEKRALFDLLEEAKALIDRMYTPTGYNIGINVGETAGQTITHVHLHLIPRYPGDVSNPRGGVRGVIPSKQSY